MEHEINVEEKLLIADHSILFDPYECQYGMHWEKKVKPGKWKISDNDINIIARHSDSVKPSIDDINAMERILDEAAFSGNYPINMKKTVKNWICNTDDRLYCNHSHTLGFFGHPDDSILDCEGVEGCSYVWCHYDDNTDIDAIIILKNIDERTEQERNNYDNTEQTKPIEFKDYISHIYRDIYGQCKSQDKYEIYLSRNIDRYLQLLDGGEPLISALAIIHYSFKYLLPIDELVTKFKVRKEDIEVMVKKLNTKCQ